MSKKSALILILVVAGLALLAVLAAIIKSDAKGEIHVVLPDNDNPFWLAVEQSVEGMRAEISDDYDLVVHTGVRQRTEDQEHLLAHVAEQSNVAAVVIGPASDSVGISEIKRFNGRGIPVVVIDTKLNSERLDSEGAMVDAFIGSDNRTGAQNAARAMAFALQDRNGTVISVRGSREHQSAVDRMEGFEPLIAQYGFEVVVIEAQWSPDTAQSRLAELFIGGEGGTVGVFASNDDMAFGVIRALTQHLGNHATSSDWPIVIGFDGTTDALLRIDEGQMYGSVAQDVEELGRQGVISAVRLANGESVLPERYLEAKMIPDRPLLPLPTTEE